jgi:hypothetical protein
MLVISADKLPGSENYLLLADAKNNVWFVKPLFGQNGWSHKALDYCTTELQGKVEFNIIMDQIKGIQKYQQVTMVTSSTIKNP